MTFPKPGDHVHILATDRMLALGLANLRGEVTKVTATVVEVAIPGSAPIRVPVAHVHVERGAAK